TTLQNRSPNRLDRRVQLTCECGLALLKSTEDCPLIKLLENIAAGAPSSAVCEDGFSFFHTKGNEVNRALIVRQPIGNPRRAAHVLGLRAVIVGRQCQTPIDLCAVSQRRPTI